VFALARGRWLYLIVNSIAFVMKLSPKMHAKSANSPSALFQPLATLAFDRFMVGPFHVRAVFFMASSEQALRFSGTVALPARFFFLGFFFIILMVPQRLRSVHGHHDLLQVQSTPAVHILPWRCLSVVGQVWTANVTSPSMCGSVR
jgi:hypothetical protein